MATPGEKHRKAIDDVKIDLASVLAERLTAVLAERLTAVSQPLFRPPVGLRDQAHRHLCVGRRGKYRNNCPETR
jgi:hypothetical protein